MTAMLVGDPVEEVVTPSVGASVAEPSNGSKVGPPGVGGSVMVVEALVGASVAFCARTLDERKRKTRQKDLILVCFCTREVTFDQTLRENNISSCHCEKQF